MKTDRTWKERIMDVTTGRNSRGAPLWYSHGKICMLIAGQEDISVSSIRAKSITPYLLGLVKSGHLERAEKPVHLCRHMRGNGTKEYLYRQTGKKFKIYAGESFESYKNKGSDASVLGYQAHKIWRDHRKLPKWFRQMML